MKTFFFFLGLLISLTAAGQSVKGPSTSSTGFEIDALPYITGGYYGSVWVSHNHFRYRAIVTRVTTPDFFLKDGFTNNKMMVYALVTDYFFQPRVEKWWIGAGFEYWDAQIQTDARLSTAKYENYIFTVGGGYVWKFHRNFYLNPWAAVHGRIAGDERVAVDGVEFRPGFFTPEASLKVGWYFNHKR